MHFCDKYCVAEDLHETMEHRHLLVDVEEALSPAVREIQDSVSRGEMLAVDCEGECLSRKGTLQLLSVATRNTVFLFDIVELKHAPFERGLRAVLESRDVKKLMFDCRGDADALLHQFNVKLQGVLDVQLLEIIKRPTRNRCDKASKAVQRRNGHKTYGVIRLASLLTCLKRYLKSNILITKKNNKIVRHDQWGARPLSIEQLEYAKVDVLSLFLLFAHFNPSREELGRLVIASNEYVGLKRMLFSRDYSEYESNGFLPSNIIPARGTTILPVGHISCTKCRRVLPLDEYTKSQLKDGVQMCRTCRKVKKEIEVLKTKDANMECAKCNNSYPKGHFSKTELEKETMICTTCTHVRHTVKGKTSGAKYTCTKCKCSFHHKVFPNIQEKNINLICTFCVIAKDGNTDNSPKDDIDAQKNIVRRVLCTPTKSERSLSQKTFAKPQQKNQPSAPCRKTRQDMDVKKHIKKTVPCTKCQHPIPKQKFAKAQLKDKHQLCTYCTETNNVFDTKDHSEANIKCVKCERSFRKEEFSKTQLKSKKQLCATCKKPNNSLRLQQNREGNIPCTQCKRALPKKEFSKTQLMKKNQLCKPCKEAKLIMDEKKNREANLARAQNRSTKTRKDSASVSNNVGSSKSVADSDVVAASGDSSESDDSDDSDSLSSLSDFYLEDRESYLDDREPYGEYGSGMHHPWGDEDDRVYYYGSN